MIPYRQHIYFKIGSFVITGIALLVIAILILGSGMLLKQFIYIETYFNESVQGLTTGSPVKYLGMEIGHVVEINTIDNVYNVSAYASNTHKHYIYVKMAISPKFFNIPKDQEGLTVIAQDINAGLRFKLAPQGLTGNVYIELDYLDPKTNIPLPIYWQPENIYIPSATSTLTYFSDNVQQLFEKLKKVNIKQFFADTQSTINNTNKVMLDVDNLLKSTNTQIIDIADNIDTVTENLNALIEQTKDFPSNTLFGKPPPPIDQSKL
jgi:paraquat-inducible protein B